MCLYSLSLSFSFLPPSLTLIQGVLHAFKGSLLKALTFAFPELQLNLFKFKAVPGISAQTPLLLISPSSPLHLPFTLSFTCYLTGGFWKDSSNRRRLFVLIARRLAFDPLVPSNWYGVTFDSIIHFKVWRWEDVVWVWMVGVGG